MASPKDSGYLSGVFNAFVARSFALVESARGTVMSRRKHVAPMLRRTRYFLLPVLLLGSMVLVSGSAAAVYDSPGEICRQMKFMEEGEPSLLWILYVPGEVVNAGLTILDDTLPDTGGLGVPASAGSYEQICINFIMICGPLLRLLP